jgi:hypothetical protein
MRLGGPSPECLFYVTLPSVWVGEIALIAWEGWEPSNLLMSSLFFPPNLVWLFLVIMKTDFGQ